MSIENITTKIKQDAETVAQSKRAEAQERKAALEAEVTATKKKLQQDAALLLDKKKQQRKAVRLSLAKQTQHIAVQETKRSALDATLQDAYNELRNMPADEYVSFLVNYAKQQDLQPDAIRSVAAPSARQTETEQILAALHITTTVEFRDDLSGGLLLHGDDHAIDLSFDRLYRDATPALEGVAKKVLFPTA